MNSKASRLLVLRLSLILCLSFTLAVSSCEVYEYMEGDEESVNFSLSPLKLDLVRRLGAGLVAKCLIGYNISYIDSYSKLSSKKASSTASTVNLNISRAYPTFVLATPILQVDSGVAKLRAGGCIYPWSSTINFPEGYSANLLKDIYIEENCYGKLDTAKRFALKFNWRRLSMEILSIMDDKDLPSPWLLNSDVLLQKLKTLSFAKTSIKPLPLVSIDIQELKAKVKGDLNLDSSDDITIYYDYVPYEVPSEGSVKFVAKAPCSLIVQCHNTAKVYAVDYLAR